MTTAPDTASGGHTRLGALDGLRGLAALVVVLHHAVQVLPATDTALDGQVPVGSLSWWVTYTPLHVLWLGEEAVLLFFLLSGYVLALPATTDRLSWVAYYPRRLLRLYVPVWGSLVVAVILVLAVPRTAEPGMSGYLVDRAQASIQDAPREGALLLGGGWLLNGPLWSLRWELLFSLLLPAYVWFARRLQWSFALSMGLVVAVLAVGVLVGSAAAYYLPVFAIGVVLAFHRARLASWGAQLRAARNARLLVAALGALAVVALTARWSAAGLGVETPADTAAPLFGACIMIFLALQWPPFSDWLHAPALQWLGLCSFSLYVIHEPVILTTAMLLPVAQVWIAAVLGPLLALAAAAVFHRYVEGPSVLWSRQVGRSVGRRWRAYA